jgi:hypothetical protein
MSRLRFSSANCIPRAAAPWLGGGAFTAYLALAALLLLPFSSFAQSLPRSTNQSRGSAFRSVLSGGSANLVSSNTQAAFIGGGSGNRIASSANYSVIAGGANNVNSGYASTIAGGLQNAVEAGASQAFIGGGQFNLVAANADHAEAGGRFAGASLFGQWARASDRFAATGDGQTSVFTLYAETGDAAPKKMVLEKQAELPLSVPSGQTMAFDILVAARSSTGQSAGYQIRGVIKNVAGAVSLIGAPTVTPLGEDVAGWDVAVQANDAVDSLEVVVTGAAATTIRWFATVRTAEVKF